MYLCVSRDSRACPSQEQSAYLKCSKHADRSDLCEIFSHDLLIGIAVDDFSKDFLPIHIP